MEYYVLGEKPPLSTKWSEQLGHKKLPFLYLIIIFLEKKKIFKAPMQGNITSGIPHLWYWGNNSGSVCLTVSNSALMTRVPLQRKHRKGQRE